MHPVFYIVTFLLMISPHTAHGGSSAPDFQATVINCCPNRAQQQDGLRVTCTPTDNPLPPHSRRSKESNGGSTVHSCVDSYSLLRSFRRTRYLDLSSNRISDLPSLSALEIASGLVFLDVSRNSLSVLSSRMLQGLSNLKTLNASHNRLVQLAADTFVDLTSLSSLDLSFNALESLPPGLLAEITQLRSLDVSHNRLGSVHMLLFESLVELRALNLSGNALTELPAEAFRRQTSLERLDLSRNKLTSFPVEDGGHAGVFLQLGKLVYLDLAGNELKAVSKVTFSGLNELQHLDLSGNQLFTLRKASFVTLPKLWWLSVRGNRLHRLHEHAFAGLRWLNWLDLSENQLVLDQETYPPDVFSPLRNLHYLFLSHNDPSTEGRYPQDVFRPLVELRHLSVDTFSTVEFGEDFAEMVRIKTLDLPACKAGVLTNESFWGFSSSPLVSIHLNGCPLQEIRGCPLCRLTHLETVSVTNNRRPATPPARGWSGNLIGPENAFLRTVNLSNTTFPGDAFQALADRTLKNLDRLKTLDLSHNGLNDEVKLTLRDGVRRVLLAGNKFQSLPLDVAGHRHLTLVDLSDNAVAFLTPEQRASLNELARASSHSGSFALRLQGNAFQCPSENCLHVAEFLSWLCPAPGELAIAPGGCEYSCAVTDEGRVASVREYLSRCQGSSPSIVLALLLGGTLAVAASAVWKRAAKARQADATAEDRGRRAGSSRECRGTTVDRDHDAATNDSVRGKGKSMSSLETEQTLSREEPSRQPREESQECSFNGPFPRNNSAEMFLARHSDINSTDPKKIWIGDLNTEDEAFRSPERILARQNNTSDAELEALDSVESCTENEANEFPTHLNSGTSNEVPETVGISHPHITRKTIRYTSAARKGSSDTPSLSETSPKTRMKARETRGRREGGEESGDDVADVGRGEGSPPISRGRIDGRGRRFGFRGHDSIDTGDDDSSGDDDSRGDEKNFLGFRPPAVGKESVSGKTENKNSSSIARTAAETLQPRGRAVGKNHATSGTSRRSKSSRSSPRHPPRDYTGNEFVSTTAAESRWGGRRAGGGVVLSSGSSGRSRSCEHSHRGAGPLAPCFSGSSVHYGSSVPGDALCSRDSGPIDPGPRAGVMSGGEGGRQERQAVPWMLIQTGKTVQKTEQQDSFDLAAVLDCLK